MGQLIETITTFNVTTTAININVTTIIITLVIKLVTIMITVKMEIKVNMTRTMDATIISVLNSWVLLILSIRH